MAVNISARNFNDWGAFFIVSFYNRICCLASDYKKKSVATCKNRLTYLLRTTYTLLAEVMTRKYYVQFEYAKIHTWTKQVQNEARTLLNVINKVRTFFSLRIVHSCSEHVNFAQKGYRSFRSQSLVCIIEEFGLFISSNGQPSYFFFVVAWISFFRQCKHFVDHKRVHCTAYRAVNGDSVFFFFFALSLSASCHALDVTKRTEAYNNNGNFPIPLADRFMSSIIRNSSMTVCVFFFVGFIFQAFAHSIAILYAHTISLLNLTIQLLCALIIQRAFCLCC